MFALIAHVNDHKNYSVIRKNKPARRCQQAHARFMTFLLDEDAKVDW